jgi:sortase A
VSLETTLRSIERGLFAAGLLIAAWWVAALLEAHAVAQRPLPDPPRASVQSLPRGVVVPARGAWLARLDVPAVGLSATVLRGSDDETLARGAGHIDGTALPGQPGNTGIAGHRDTTFRLLRRLSAGDRIELTTVDRVYRYSVTRTFVVDPEDVHVLDPGDSSLLTLVTCYPFDFIGPAPRRYIVHAELVGDENRAAREWDRP